MQPLRRFTAINIDKMRAQHMVMLTAKSFLSSFIFFVNTYLWRKWHGDNPCLPTSTWHINKDDIIFYTPVAAFLYGLRQWYTRSVIMELLEAADDSDRRGW
jgi:hypothetical protein